MKKEKLFMIISISIFIICIIGSTYALYTKTLSNDVGINTNTPGLDKYINYVKGTDITGTLTASSSYTGGTSSNIEFWKKDNTYDIYGKIVLTVNTIGTNLSNSPALKYALVNNGNVLSEGSLQGTTANSQITLVKNLELQATKQIYTVYVWLDSNETLGNISGESISVSVDCTADMVPSPTFADTIKSLYTDATKTTVTNNSITYNYATSVSLMNDRLGSSTTDINGGNIRYYGANPNNYVYFNCSDYSNQSSTTCELWRIIGVFNGKVKLIRNESIGAYSWDNKNTTTGAESDYGKNDWTTARLMKLLNPSNYYTTDTNDNGYGQSLYYNAQSGTCFSGQNNATTSCNFTSTGLKNDTTRNMISTETYYLRGYNSILVYSDQMYNYERTTGSVYNTSRPISWTEKVALAYLSDYGYAVDFNYCTQNLSYYGSDSKSTCASNNWMRNILGTSSSGWLLTPDSNDAYRAWYVYSSGNVGSCYDGTYESFGVVPVLHLNSNIELASNTGNGTSTNPYRLSV